MVAILGYSNEQIRDAVQQMYTHVAESPQAPFHFPTGQATCVALGYPEEQVSRLPQSTAASFAGVGWPFRGQVIQPGHTTLDLGSGAGNDSLIAGDIVGPSGQVIALDLTAAMVQKLRRCIAGKYPNIHPIQGSAEEIPLLDQSMDSITSNGALNLVPSKRKAIREMFRILKPGGKLQLADVVIHRPVTVDCEDDPRLWVECVVGATVEEDLLAMLGDVGFEDIRILNRHDYFALSPSQQTRDIARSFGACSVELSATRASKTPGLIREWARRLNPRRWLGQLHRQGFSGLLALSMALVTCYGILAISVLLTLLGVQLSLSLQVWSFAIAVFTVITALIIGSGFIRHRKPSPGLLATLGTALVLFALYISYHAATELLGFALLAGAAGLDLNFKRKLEARKLGLKR
ncbi:MULTISPECIES: MerC family mercury resistance protein [unclassified Marinobacter]|uniref:MerC family mercury resistance protein n=1 Tax=unclassified Marinobacter TaxID=83889 RepID=UPI001268672A|nr:MULTISPECIES: MerC family mercury resistance protein [unclassified Marinobacter]QFS86230.1 Ubiquinone/menaquinone biosynthesis C-methyltransferase UbiE [Marinobacter sp. THAF197a]QFT50011.1 Ubiquinone/menaquinone biosynthesis C-methyltransferase UbiE [Marinobacter sp. THAF39]